MNEPATSVMGGHRRGNILQLFPREFKPEPTADAMFRQHVAQWFLATKMLRYWESELLNNGSAGEKDLAMHRLACSTLITFGEFASMFAREHEGSLNLQAINVKVVDIEAETRLLRGNFKMYHDPGMTDDQAEDILSNAFK